METTFKDQKVKLVVQNIIFKDIYSRNFTKRQRAILSFIGVFSLAMGKPSAHIPNLSDFELCGVSKTKIKEELSKLVDLHIIEWKKEQNRNVFTLKPVSNWKIQQNYVFSNSRYEKIYEINKQQKKSLLESHEIALDENFILGLWKQAFNFENEID